MSFAVLVVGSPGSGKSTLCLGLQQFYAQVNRKTVFVNLDPANDALPFSPDYDVRRLVSFEQVCEQEKMGPNGAFLRCIEMVEGKADELKDELCKFGSDRLFVFDCPGQIELYSIHPSLNNILAKIGFRFAVVNVVDFCQCQSVTSFISLSLLSLQAMLNLELPQINVLSKIDLVGADLGAPLSAFCYNELSTLLEYHKLSDYGSRFPLRYERLTALISDLIEEHSLVSYIPYAVEDKDSVVFISREIDRITGYAFGGLTDDNESIRKVAYSSSPFEDYVDCMNERYLQHSEEIENK